jgi:cation-transporting P-type ATPase F
MITAVTLGVVLALETAEPGVMGRPPRRAGKPIVGKLILWRCLYVGTLLIVAMLGNMQWELDRAGAPGSPHSLARGRAVAMATLTTGQAFYIYNCRSLSRPVVVDGVVALLTSNPALTLMAVVNVGLQCLLLYAPELQGVFGVAALDGHAWLRCIGFAAAVFVLVEVDKVLGTHSLRLALRPALVAVHRSVYGCGSGSSPTSTRTSPEAAPSSSSSSSSSAPAISAPPTGGVVSV